MLEEPTETVILSWAQLFRAQRRLLDQAETDLKRAGLPPLAWYDALLEVYRAPEQRIRQNELGSKMLLGKHNVSRLVDRLEAEGLVVRESCHHDGRGAIIALQAHGRAQLKKMWAVYGRTIQTCLGARLSASEVKQLYGLLVKLDKKNAD